MSKTDIKKGDEVVIIAGAEKGKRGEILTYDRADERVTVKGLNLVKRHLKRAQDGTGGITEKDINESAFNHWSHLAIEKC